MTSALPPMGPREHPMVRYLWQRLSDAMAAAGSPTGTQVADLAAQVEALTEQAADAQTAAVQAATVAGQAQDAAVKATTDSGKALARPALAVAVATLPALGLLAEATLQFTWNTPMADTAYAWQAVVQPPLTVTAVNWTTVTKATDRLVLKAKAAIGLSAATPVVLLGWPA